jgi:hypothetical protein
MLRHRLFDRSNLTVSSIRRFAKMEKLLPERFTVDPRGPDPSDEGRDTRKSLRNGY